MESSIHTMTPLRQRMIDDMRMRKLTQYEESLAAWRDARRAASQGFH
jgi:hypothetical protein